jgi:hypothetical protein
MLLHPTRYELLAYSEALETGQGISTELGRHVTACPSCSAEVRALRDSLALVRAAVDLEVPRDLTDQIIEAARAERRAQERTRTRVRTMVSVAKGLAFAAGIVLVSALSFRTALADRPGSSPAVHRADGSSSMFAANPSPEEIRSAAGRIATFASAVSARSTVPRNSIDLRNARTVAALDADLTVVRAALERYPGSERAHRLMQSNLQRQAQALKTLYVEQTL